MYGSCKTYNAVKYHIHCAEFSGEMTQHQVAQKPLWHKNREVQTTPINRTAREGAGGVGGGGGSEIRRQSVDARETEMETNHTDGRKCFIFKLL